MMNSEEENNHISQMQYGRNIACETQDVVPIPIPIPKHEKPLEKSEETSNGNKEWRKSNLFLEIPNRGSNIHQDSIQTKIPQTSTPKRVNFHLSPSGSRSSVSCEPSSTRGKSSSIKNFLPNLSFKNRTNSDGDKALNFDSVYSNIVARDKPSIQRSWSFSKIFTPRVNRTSSLPVTRVSNSNQDSAHGRSVNDMKQVRVISRSLSIPIFKNEKCILRTNSFFRVIPSTTEAKDWESGMSKAVIGDHENNEDIPEDEAVCRICLVELCEGGETLTMECSCKGELALAHQDCIVKWFAIKGNKTCDICKQEVLNLPVTLLRIQSSINRDSHTRNFGQMEINGYRVWQDLPILVIVSTLGYFCFLEQLLAKKMDSSSIAISVPFSCLLGLLASLTSSMMVKRRFVWIYALIQFTLVVTFGHIFYNFVHVQAFLSIFLSTFAGFGVAMGGAIIIVEALRWRLRWRGITIQNETRNELHPSRGPPPSQMATPSNISPRLHRNEEENQEAN